MDDTMTSEWIHMYTFVWDDRPKMPNWVFVSLMNQPYTHSTRMRIRHKYLHLHTQVVLLFGLIKPTIYGEVSLGYVSTCLLLVAAGGALRRICAERCAQEMLREYT